jgi:holo-[acyl-carrier protein] synthase
MKIVGIGVDLVELGRVDLALQRGGSGFVDELLNTNEQQAAGRRIESTAFIAGRIVAKEAVAKALGTGFNGFHWHEIEIGNDVTGRPVARLLGRAARIAQTHQITKCLISITHTAHYATAQALAVGSAKKEEPL